MIKHLFILAFVLFISAAHSAELHTTAERTQFRQTGRYAEVPRLCEAFQKAYPGNVRCFTFGMSPEGRPMKALAVTTSGSLTAKAARAAGQPVLLIQAGIHAGEIDGKDAEFLWLREALQGKYTALKKVTVVLVPVFNVDGHERFGAHNRPNQVGPEEMGWRTTAQNFNLNRDYTKADAPETQAMLKLLNEWDPIVYTDLHVTDGAQFQHSISLNFRPNHLTQMTAEPTAGNRSLIDLAVDLENRMKHRLDEKGFQPVTFYPDFIETDNPASGFQDGLSSPRLSHPYWGLRNRIGLLVETHSWKDYATRVRATHDTIEALVEFAAKDGRSWIRAAQAADEAAAKSAPGSPLVLRYEASKKSRPLAFQGYAYKIENSKISGQKRIIYDIAKKETWTVPFFEDLQPKTIVTLPHGGYLIEAAQAGWIEPKLSLHGIRFEHLKKAHSGVALEVFRAENMQLADKSFEGRQSLKVSGAWKSEKRDLAAGALYIPVNQPRAALIAHLLEPASEDSFLAWGFFNACFEQKEYMEDYVAEGVAEEMLKDPSIRAEFTKKLEDKEFAKNPRRRLDFFYRKHPSWDEKMGLYPIYRAETAPN